MKRIATLQFNLSLILTAVFLLQTSACSLWPWKKAPAPQERKITMKALLGEMADLDSLFRFPDPPYVTRQASSYDRKSVASGNDDWFANDDSGKFIRVEDHGDRKEFVMMDADGPGVVTRIWSANPKGTIRFYFNGSGEPGFSAPMTDLLGAKLPDFPSPISGIVSAGWNLYFPIPYAKHLKITADAEKFYYHVNYRTYPAGTEVEEFSISVVEGLKGEIQAAMDRLLCKEEPVAGLKDAPHDALKSGGKKLLFESSSKKSVVDLLRVHVQADDLSAALRGILLEAYFDDEVNPTILCPLGDFFGSSPGINPYQSLPLGMLEDGTMFSRWVMPFRKSAKFYVINKSAVPVSIASQVGFHPLRDGWTHRTLYFHAGYRAGFDMPTRPFRDWNYVGVQGKGMFVGDSLAIVNASKKWWGEGDEKIYVDGETFPSHFGTGTEDYYGYAWGSSVKFQHPYHNQSRCDGPGSYGHTAVNRFHIFDAIPFQKDFRFDMEVWHWDTTIPIHYAAVSYWYAQPGATNNLPLPTGTDLTVPVVPPLPRPKVAGAIEAESLSATVSGGKLEPQDMLGFEGKWSNESQAWFHDAHPGDSVAFNLDAPEEGDYQVLANFTKASDYGVAEISINGKVAVASMDFYDAKVKATGETDLGAWHLTKSGNKITLKISGANDKAEKNYMIGVDYFLLRPAK